MSFRQRFISLWNSGAEPWRLDCFRIAFALSCLALFSRIVPYLSAGMPDCMWNPPGLAEYFLPTPLSIKTIKLLSYFFAGALLFLALGIFSRLSALLSGCLAFVLLGTSHAAHFFNTSGNSLIFVFFILAAAPSLGSSLSVDRIRKGPQSYPDSEKIWPQRLIHFLFFFLFFAAGLSKILASNGWADSENLIAILKWTRAYYGPGSIDPVRDWIHHFLISSPNLAHVLGIAVIAVELSAAFFFFTNKYRNKGVLLLLSLHVGIILTMYFTYILIFPLYLIFVPWERIVSGHLSSRL